jgi:hypothetical protein
MNLNLLIRLIAVSAIVAGCSDSGSDGRSGFADPVEGSLVVIGDSGAAGMVDMRQFSESQRWAYPTYVAHRLGAVYSTPELAQIEIDGELLDGDLDFFAIPDLRTMFNPPLVPAPYDNPGLPYPFDKQRPDEEHTNIAVPGATLAGAMNVNDQASDISVIHSILNKTPYFETVGGGNAVSQLDIAIALDPAPTTIIVDLGANDLLRTTAQAWNPVSPDVFDADYRMLMAMLRNDNPDALIIGINVPGDFRIGSLAPTASEADEIYDRLAGTMSGLLGAPAADSRFQMLPLLSYLRGGDTGDPGAPQPITSADQADADKIADSYNQSIQLAINDIEGVYIDHAAFIGAIASDGLDVTIDGMAYHLDVSYGDGLKTLDGLHYTKTLHALFANYIIETLNTALSMAMPPVDVDAIAATDKHVLRALGLD